MDIKFLFSAEILEFLKVFRIDFLWTNSEYFAKIKKTKNKWTNLLYFSVEVLLFRLFSNCWELLFLHINIYTIPVLCISKVRWTIKIRNLYFFLWNFSLFLALIDVVCTCPLREDPICCQKCPILMQCVFTIFTKWRQVQIKFFFYQNALIYHWLYYTTLRLVRIQIIVSSEWKKGNYSENPGRKILPYCPKNFERENFWLSK